MHALSVSRWSASHAVVGVLAIALFACGDVVVPADAGGSSTTSTSDAAGTVCRDLCGTPDCGECPTNPMIAAGNYASTPAPNALAALRVLAVAMAETGGRHLGGSQGGVNVARATASKLGERLRGFLIRAQDLPV